MFKPKFHKLDASSALNRNLNSRIMHGMQQSSRVD